MFDRLKALLVELGGPAEDRETTGGSDELHVSMTALMVEAALLDGCFDERERERIVALVGARFDLSEGESQALLRTAEARVDGTHQLYGFTKTIKDRLAYEERLELMEMLWQIAYADGELHDYEANLMRRVAGLLYVDDRDSGQARKRALETLRQDPVGDTNAG